LRVRIEAPLAPGNRKGGGEFTPKKILKYRLVLLFKPNKILVHLILGKHKFPGVTLKARSSNTLSKKGTLVNLCLLGIPASRRIIASSDPYHEGGSAGYPDLSAREDSLILSV
jgi:hypothetical protein